MKQTQTKTEKIFSTIFLILTAGIVAGIFWFNFNGRAFYNCDMYADALVVKQMWLEKSIFPESWVFGNQFYVAATPVLGALMYGIIGDSFWALSSASCIMTVLVLLSFVYCMTEAVEKKYLPLGLFCISGAGIICTGACTNVFGWQIFYTMASYYASYFIGILLTMGVWLRLKKYNKANLIMVIVVLLLNGALGMNSLRQTLTACLPLIGLECVLLLWESVRQKKFVAVIRSSFKRLLFSAGVLISNLCGVILIRVIDVNSAPIIEEVKLSYLPSEIFKNFIATAKSIASILGFSIYDKGIKYIPLLIIAGIFLLIAITAVILIIKDKEETPLTYLIMYSVISLAALAVTGVFILRTRHIYYFIWFFMLVCCIIYLAKRFKGKLGISLLSVILVCGIVNCSYSFISDYKKYRERHEIFDSIANELIDDGVEYIFSGMQFTNRIATYSKDKITHGLVFWDFEKETGKFFYPVWYIQSKELFEHTDDESAVFAMTSVEWERLKKKVPQEYIDELSSCFELYKSFEGLDSETYYFYNMKKDIISDFGVIANVDKPYQNQLD